MDEVIEKINKIFECLPNELRDNKIFKKIIEMFIERLDYIDNYSISVCDNIYNRLNDWSLDNNKTINDNLLDLEIKGDTNTYLCIEDRSGSYYLELTYISIDEEQNQIKEEITIFFDIEHNEINIEYTNSTVNNKLFLDYDYKYYSYDKEGNLLKKDYSKIIDENFNAMFYIPLEECKYYRNHFQEHIIHINNSKLLGFYKDIDDMYVNASYANFSGPFDIDEYKEFIYNDLGNNQVYDIDTLDELSNNLDEDDENGGLFQDDEYDDSQEVSMELLELICNGLLNFLEEDKIFIITKNINVNIYHHLTNENNSFIDTNGIVITRDENDYTLYYLHIDGENILWIPRKLDKESLYEIYYADELAGYTDDMHSFFEFNNPKYRKRKKDEEK